MQSYETMHSSVLMIADIVAFSALDEPQQRESVKGLLGELLSLELVQERAARNELFLNSTGDGFLLALPLNGEVELAERCVAMAIALIAWSKARGRGRPKVRVGLHLGSMYQIEVPHERRRMAVGHGLNWCTRVADLADDLQVLASEEFVEHFRSCANGADVASRFHPPLGRAPFQVGVKHGRVADVRAIRDPILNKAPPPKFVRNEALDVHLGKSLQVVGQTLMDALPQLVPGLDLARASPRLTLWVPDKVAGVLRPSEHQHGAEARAQGSRDRVTAYAFKLNRPKKCQGPVALAYEAREPVALNRIAPWGQDPETAIRQWGALGVPEVTVRTFTRFPRCVLAIPLVLRPDRATGVLCIDLMIPLEVDDSDLIELGRWIQKDNGIFMASLLEVRMN